MPFQTIELEHVIFGLLATDCEIINFCVLHAKWFMYIQYMSDSANFSGACNVRNCCGYLKNIVKIEKDCNVIKKLKCHTYINAQKIVAHFFCLILFCPNFFCIMVCLYQTVGQ